MASHCALRPLSRVLCCEQNDRILRSQVLHLQQQVNELNAKQVDLLGQKQQLQVRQLYQLLFDWEYSPRASWRTFTGDNINVTCSLRQQSTVSSQLQSGAEGLVGSCHVMWRQTLMEQHQCALCPRACIAVGASAGDGAVWPPEDF